MVNLDETERIVSRSGGSSRELLTRFMGEFTRRVSGSPLSGIPKLVMAEAGNFPEIASFYHDEVIQRGRRLIQGILKRGVDSGEFRPVDVDYAWRVVIAPLMLGILWKHSFLAFDPRPFDFDRHLQSHLDLLFDGLAAAKD